MVRIVLTVWAATLTLGGVALGQNAAPAAKAEVANEASKPSPPSQRYRFSHTAEGILRLDQESGQVMLCRSLGNGWACNPAPDETAVLQIELKRKDEEVKKLTAQVDQLKTELARGQEMSADRLKSAQADVARLQAELAALKNEVLSVAGRVGEAGKQAITQQERQDMVSRLALLEQDNGGLKGALKRLADENASLRKQIADTPKVPDLEPAVTQAIGVSEVLKRDLAAAGDRIARLEKQVADDSARRELNAAVTQARDANEALKKELAVAKTQLAALQKQVADQTDRNAQQAAIEQLRKENSELTDKLASLEMGNAAMQAEIDALKPPLPLPKAEVPPDKKDELKLPSREEIDRARTAVVDAWRRVMEMIGQLQKDMMGSKSAPPVRL